jgi:hypothetical protein
MMWQGQDSGESDVVMVFWPAQAAKVDELRADGIPRLIIVSGDAPAPSAFDDREEWVRLPAEATDLGTRLEALRNRLARAPRPKPWLDQDGRLHVGKQTIDLPASEASLAAVFLDDFERLVPQETLAKALPERVPKRAITTYVARLRAHIASLGLTITSVRARGYIMSYLALSRGFVCS